MILGRQLAGLEGGCDAGHLTTWLTLCDYNFVSSHELEEETASTMLALTRTLGKPATFAPSSYAEKRLLCIATGRHGGRGMSSGQTDSRRYKTTEAGDEKSGHINAGPNEGILFLDSQRLTLRKFCGVVADVQYRCFPP